MILSNFAETLKGLMVEHNNMTGKELAKAIGVAAPTITRYLRAERMPDIDILILIADFFNCSTDYLLDRESDYQNLTFKKCPPFTEQIDFLVKYSKQTELAFYTDAKISQSSFFEWKNGSSKPTIESIEKIADHLDRRVDFVLGRES